MTSKKKRYAQPAATPAPPAASETTTREWVIRGIAVVAIVGGAVMALIGVTPGIAGGWGKLVLVMPGVILATGGVVAFIETTSMARSRRPTRRRFGR